MNSFLNCNIWSVYLEETGLAFVKSIYPYNSNTSDFNIPTPIECIQIPDFEINNLELLNKLDHVLISKYKISIIKKDKDEQWHLNLEDYDKYFNM